jgi:hypothetical protein
MPVSIMDVEFVKVGETKHNYVFRQPKHIKTNLHTTILYINKAQFPDGPPDRITAVIEARTKG